MRIYECLNNNGKVEKWECYFDDKQIKTFAVGEIFIEWCARPAVRAEESFESSKNIKNDNSEIALLLKSVIPEEWLAESKEPYYSETQTTRLIKNAINDGDMSEIYDIVLTAVHDNFGIELERCEFGLRDLPKQSTVTVEPFYLADYYGIEKSNIRYGKCYNISAPSMPWQDAFVLIDLQEMLQNKNLKLKVCKHCYRVFIEYTKNKGYCPKCDAERIPEKRKHNTPRARLYNRICVKLEKRMGETPDNIYGITDLESFRNAWYAFKAEVKDKEERISWLEDVDKAITKKPRKKKRE